jgi:serine phosphatase RsbU (regulator of sigma subunit)
MVWELSLLFSQFKRYLLCFELALIIEMTPSKIINEDNLNFTKKLSQQMFFNFVLGVPSCSKFL